MTCRPRAAVAVAAALGFAYAAVAGAQPAPATPAAPSPSAANALAYPPSVPTAPAHGPIPGKSETAMEAFGKLNRSNAGYLTWEDVRQLEGFETAFEQADQNHDGRLNPAEFNSAWAMYTGNTP